MIRKLLDKIKDFICWLGLHFPQSQIRSRVLSVTCGHCGQLLYRGVV